MPMKQTLHWRATADIPKKQVFLFNGVLVVWLGTGRAFGRLRLWLQGRTNWQWSGASAR